VPAPSPKNPGKFGAIFDLDGTIADTIQDLASSINRALAALGWPEHPVGDYLP
jgi:phosphoglycolate phosphatase